MTPVASPAPTAASTAPTRAGFRASARVLTATGLVALVLAFGGCGGEEAGKVDGGKPSGTDGSGKPAGGQAAALTLTLWEQMDPQEREVQKGQIAAYERDHPGMKIELSHYGTEDLRTQFQTAAIAGSGPDLVYGPSDQVGPFSVMGLILPLDTVLSAEELAGFREDAFDRLGGHIYALPDQVGNHLTLVWNKALLAQPPQTMGELIEMAKAATVDENGDGRPERYGLVFQVMEPFWIVPFLTGYGGWVMDAENRPTLHTGAMTQALTLVQSFRDEHRIMPTECDYEIADTIFKEGRAAMIINGPWSWEAYRKAGVDIGLARIPQIEATGLWPAPMISSKGYSLNAKLSGDRLAAVLEALRYLTKTEFQVEYAREVGTLPTRKDAYERAEVAENPILSASSEQVEVGKRMPVVPEMRAIWDAMRPSVQSVWNGTVAPADAAREMQQLAVRKIREMKG